MEVNFVNDSRLTYGFVLNLTGDSMNRESTIERGYFFNSGTGCFHYGTILTDDNGRQLFIADTDIVVLIGHRNFPVCPDYDEAFARNLIN